MCGAMPRLKSDARKHGLKGNHRKSETLWWSIEQMDIDEDWFPSQIAGVLRKEGIHIVKQTVQAYMNVLKRQMAQDLKIGRWTPSWIHRVMPWSLLLNVPLALC